MCLSLSVHTPRCKHLQCLRGRIYSEAFERGRLQVFFLQKWNCETDRGGATACQLFLYNLHFETAPLAEVGGHLVSWRALYKNLYCYIKAIYIELT